MVVEYPRACNSFARDAAMMPLPKEEVTPPVTKTYLVELDINKFVTTGVKDNTSFALVYSNVNKKGDCLFLFMPNEVILLLNGSVFLDFAQGFAGQEGSVAI